MDLVGQMKVVLFAPTDLHLVDGSPDDRRKIRSCHISQDAQIATIGTAAIPVGFAI